MRRPWPALGRSAKKKVLLVDGGERCDWPLEFPGNIAFRIIQCRMSQRLLQLFVNKSASHFATKPCRNLLAMACWGLLRERRWMLRLSASPCRWYWVSLQNDVLYTDALSQFDRHLLQLPKPRDRYILEIPNPRSRYLVELPNLRVRYLLQMPNPRNRYLLEVPNPRYRYLLELPNLRNIYLLELPHRRVRYLLQIPNSRKGYLLEITNLLYRYLLELSHPRNRYLVELPNLRVRYMLQMPNPRDRYMLKLPNSRDRYIYIGTVYSSGQISVGAA
jgi:hypothetical protein